MIVCVGCNKPIDLATAFYGPGGAAFCGQECEKSNHDFITKLRALDVVIRAIEPLCESDIVDVLRCAGAFFAQDGQL